MNKSLAFVVAALPAAASVAVALNVAVAAPVAVAASRIPSAAFDNWPQWRGPNLDGTTDETGLPTTWSTEQNVVWKLDVPAWTGSTPIIWEDSIFLNVSYVSRNGAGGFGGFSRRGGGRGGRGGGAPAASEPETLNVELWRVDRRDGSVIWKKFLSDNDHQERKQNMSTPSPVTDGEHVWVMTGTGWLRCFDFDGNEVWSRNISNDYWRFGLNWGYASSPLLHEDALFVQVLHGMRTDDPSYLLRIDKLTGETVWMVQRPTDAVNESPDAYTTPALLQVDGVTQIVVTGGDVVTGHHPESGEELWRVEGLNPRNNRNYRIVASPVIIGDIIVAPTRERPMLVLKAGGRDDLAATRVLWSFDHGPDVPTPVSDGEVLYVLTDNGVLYCLDLQTGEEIYGQKRLEPGTYSASPILADGKIYATNEDGVTTVVKAGREFEILATNSLDGYTLSTPAFSHGHIYARIGERLYAIAAGS